MVRRALRGWRDYFNAGRGERASQIGWSAGTLAARAYSLSFLTNAETRVAS
jgi:hypothetical protein